MPWRGIQEIEDAFAPRITQSILHYLSIIVFLAFYGEVSTCLKNEHFCLHPYCNISIIVFFVARTVNCTMLFCQLNRHVSKNDRILCSIIQFRLKAVILPIL